MPDKLHFSLVSPERQLVSEDVDQVDVPGAEGVFGVLPNHAPFMSTLAPGVLIVRNDGGERRIFVRGGFAEVTAEGLTVLAEQAIFVADLKAADLDKRIRECEEDLADADTLPETRLYASAELAQLKELRAAL